MSVLGDLAAKAAKKAVAERMAVKTAERTVEREAPRMAVKALPAPPKRLALPPPKPKPDPRFKPRGGQWYPNKDIPQSELYSANYSPEKAASQSAGEMLSTHTPEFRMDHTNTEWLKKALTKYYKNDFGTEDDPLRGLAERGLHYDPDMTPDRWTQTVNDSLMEDPIGSYTVPPHWGKTGDYDPIIGPAIVEAAPWLTKQPVTDNLYSIGSPLDLGHFADEFRNALNPEASGLPPELAVRPESLQRMSFPQAVEHVGRINQFRVKQMEDAAQAAMNNPAIHPHKDYGDGMRWVELKQPAGLPEGYSVQPHPEGHLLTRPDGDGVGVYPDLEQAARDAHVDSGYGGLQEALKHEGDTMGHCVGGYCDDVVSGRSRIFSLRDAKGQPHVTVETAPKSMVYSDLVSHLGGDTSAADDYLVKGYQAVENDTSKKSALAHAMELAGVPQGQDIVQIKGKQNRAPNDEYLPYVQDFVKSGQWGNVGDFGNTGLVKLPDGRYITKQQHAEAVASPTALELFKGDADGAANQLAQWNLNTYNDDDWARTKHIFEGFAYGGRVAAHRDFARHPLAVGRA